MRWFRRKRFDPPPSALPRRVRRLEVLSSRLIRSGFAGDYHSAFHGKGVEFAQVREYMPGDDIRTIDWNVTARSGVPHVKQFVEERDLTVMIVIDVSRSMAFGSVDRRKIDRAVELAAVLSFAAVENNDRVGLLLFGPKVRRYFPPRKGRTWSQAIIRAALAEGLHPDGPADLETTVRFLQRVSVKRNVMLFISDFLDMPFERALERLSRKHDVIALAISDPREHAFPSRGLVRLVDGESGQASQIDLSKNRVRASAGRRVMELVQGFRRAKIDHLFVSTAIPYERDLLGFFRNRVLRAP